MDSHKKDRSIFHIFMMIGMLCVLSLSSMAFDYPEHVATEQDYLNLLSMPEHRAQALDELKTLNSIDDSTSTRVLSGSEEGGDLVTDEIATPKPVWKQKRFKDKDKMRELINKYDKKK